MGGAAGDYHLLAAGGSVLSAGAAGGPATDVPITVGANQVISVVLLPGSGAIVARPRVDAAGPSAMPPGPIDAGYGGMAGPRPGATTGMAALALLAAVATGVAVRLRRRSGEARPRSW